MKSPWGKRGAAISVKITALNTLEKPHLEPVSAGLSDQGPLSRPVPGQKAVKPNKTHQQNQG
jgi:hypothetical protein